MEHPNAILIRKFYNARAMNDRAAIRTLVADDVKWHDPYPPPHGGDLVGIGAVFRDIFDAAGKITAGSTKLHLHDVLANDEHAVALVEWSAAIKDRTMHGCEVAVFHIENGKIAEAWFYPEDKAAVDAFFNE
jgi:ketosteroid isomerase-like protein